MYGTKTICIYKESVNIILLYKNNIAMIDTQ